MAKTKEEKLADIEAELAEAREKAQSIAAQAAVLAEEKEKPELAGRIVEVAGIKIPSVEDLGEIPTPDLGMLPPADTRAIDTAFADATSTSVLLAQQIEQQRLAREEFEKTLTTAGVTGENVWQRMLSLVGKKPEAERQRILEEQQARFEVPEWLAKVQAQNVKVATIQGDITRMETQYLVDVEREKNRQVAMPVIDAAVNARTRTYQSERAFKVAEMSAEAAVMQAFQGNLSAARGLVSDAVNAYVYDIQQQRSDFDTIFNIYGEWINSLEAKDQDLLNQTRKDLEAEEARVREDKTNLLNLMLNNPEAGIILSDTLESATEKVVEWRKVQPEEVPTYAPTQYTREWQEAGGLEGTGMSQSDWIKFRTGITEIPGVIEGEPAPRLRSMAQRYLTATPEEQEQYIPTSARDQADFWAEVDWIQAQQPEIGKAQIEVEFMSDKEAGMPIENALTMYGTDLGEDWVREQYKAEVKPGVPLWQKALEFTAMPWTWMTKLFK